MINFEQLDRAIDYAIDHPDEFYMGSWVSNFPEPAKGTDGRMHCGTTACLAGTVAVLNGFRTTLEFSTELMTSGSFVLSDGSPGGVRSIQDVATEILGLDDIQRDNIFHRTSILGVIMDRNAFAKEQGVPVRVWKVPAELLAPREASGLGLKAGDWVEIPGERDLW